MSDRNVWDDGRWAAVKEITFDFMTNYIMENVLSCVSAKNKRTVELGSGTGRLSYLMLKNGAQKVTMVDSSKKAIHLAQRLFQGEDPNSYELVESDIFNFEPDEEFDIGFSSGVIEHFKARDRFEIIRKHVTLSRSDCVVLHPSNTLYQRVFSAFPPAVKLYGFAKPYTIEEINNYIGEIKEIERFSHKQFYPFYSVPIFHDRETINRRLDRTWIGTTFGGFVLTHLVVNRGEVTVNPRLT